MATPDEIAKLVELTKDIKIAMLTTVEEDGPSPPPDGAAGGGARRLAVVLRRARLQHRRATSPRTRTSASR